MSVVDGNAQKESIISITGVRENVRTRDEPEG